MKINGSDQLGPVGRQNGSDRKVQGERAASAKAQPQGDRLELSDEARRIGALGKAAAILPDVRTEKVEAIRQSLEDGVYEVDARLLAGKILEFEDGFGS